MLLLLLYNTSLTHSILNMTEYHTQSVIRVKPWIKEKLYCRTPIINHLNPRLSRFYTQPDGLLQTARDREDQIKEDQPLSFCSSNNVILCISSSVTLTSVSPRSSLRTAKACRFINFIFSVSSRAPCHHRAQREGEGGDL